MPKIREIDDLLRQRPDLKACIREVHPELSFCLLNGQPLSHPKRKRAGQQECRALLESVFTREEIQTAVSDCRPKGAKADDVIDALVALWSAGRVSIGEAEASPPDADRDRNGPRMQILA
jgi:predicted RNase H-like nuclease